MGLGLRMNHNNSISKLLVCLGLIAVTSCAKSQALKPLSGLSLDTWPKRCRALKLGLSIESATNNTLESVINNTFQPRPDNIAINASWKLNWFEQQVPIPATDYAEVRISDHGDDEYSLMLLNKSKTVFIILGQQPNDIFTLSSESESASPEEIALLKKQFGGRVSFGKMMNLGYRHTLDDLTCTEARAEQESLIAIALTLKGIGYGSTATVYDLNSGVGALHHFPNDSKDQWMFQVDDGKYDLEVFLKLPKEHPHGDLGLFIGREDWQAAQGVPLWLTQLETAFANPSRKNWQALQIALREANMSSKSLQMIQELIDKSPD